MRKYRNLIIDFDLDQTIQELCFNVGYTTETFYNLLEKIIKNYGKEVHNLLKERNWFQDQIDYWFKQNKSNFTLSNYYLFLKKLKYIVPVKEYYKIETTNIDEEIKDQAAPQLVCPSDNIKFIKNAYYARWGLLNQALLKSNVVEKDNIDKFINNFLNKTFPLKSGFYEHIVKINLKNNVINFLLPDNESTSLKNQSKYLGYTLTSNKQLHEIILKNNNLHVILILKNEKIENVLIESAVTSIIDFEDSVATVNVYDKLKVYTNWIKLMNGSFVDGSFKNNYFNYISKENIKSKLPRSSLLLVRNVGNHIYTDMITYKNNKIPEGFIDLLICVFASLHKNSKYNSKYGSIYIVKPKMHGPSEIQLMENVFTMVEEELKLKENQIKLGIMDEERRTSINLDECIRIAKKRIFFINTGFLDRTGDDIRTSTHYGPVPQKDILKYCNWLNIYEKSNVEIGLKRGLHKIGQIGKGMWAKPDDMKSMYEEKINHLLMGANTSWVPSPLAATIHALHYHQVNVKETQKTLLKNKNNIIDMLKPTIITNTLTEKEIDHELRNNIQSLVGYTLKWINEGLGCSKIADINNVNLMEDRATLRISSQHIHNWIVNEVTTKEHIKKIFVEMTSNYDKVKYSLALEACHKLIFEAYELPNGYTEPVLFNIRSRYLEKVVAKL